MCPVMIMILNSGCWIGVGYSVVLSKEVNLIQYFTVGGGVPLFLVAPFAVKCKLVLLALQFNLIVSDQLVKSPAEYQAPGSTGLT